MPRPTPGEGEVAEERRVESHPSSQLRPGARPTPRPREHVVVPQASLGWVGEVDQAPATEAQRLLARIAQRYFDELPRPAIAPLSEGARALEEKFSALVAHLPDRPPREGPLTETAWGAFAALNLKGQRTGDFEAEKAVRFSHLYFCEGPVLHPPARLSRVLREAFTTDRSRFPWEGAAGAASDPRLRGIDFGHIDVLSTNDAVKPSLAPAILRAGALDDEVPALEKLLGVRPFVVLVKESPGGTVFQLFCNHEYLDGVQAAHHLRAFLEGLGLSPAPLEALPDEAVTALLAGADARENRLSGKADFDVHSAVLSPELTFDIQALFARVREGGEQAGVRVSFPAFVQLLVLHLQGVNGAEVRGGYLGFRPALDEQLGHFRAGNATALMGALLSGSRQQVVDAGAHVSSDGRLDLYPTEENNVLRLLRPIGAAVPPGPLRQVLNGLSQSLEVSRAATGQAMTSFMPSRLALPNGARLELGGLAGPALTGYQDVATTVNAVGGPEATRLFVRQKARRLA